MEPRKKTFVHGGLVFEPPCGKQKLSDSVRREIAAYLGGCDTVLRAWYIRVSDLSGENEGFQFAIQFPGGSLIKPPPGTGELFEEILEMTAPWISPRQHYGVVMANNLAAPFGPEGAATYIALSECVYDKGHNGNCHES